MRYLKQLLERAEKISLQATSQLLTEREPEDNYVAALPNGLKKLWILMEIAKQRSEEINEEGLHRFGGISDDMRDSFMDEIKQLHQKYLLAQSEYELLKECFWTSVRHEFPDLADANTVGIRKGWQIVKVNVAKKAKRDIENFLGKILQELRDSDETEDDSDS